MTIMFHLKLYKFVNYIYCIPTTLLFRCHRSERIFANM